MDRNKFDAATYPGATVALLAEGVDRNIEISFSFRKTTGVALLAEGVDRNTSVSPMTTYPAVALLAEGVDRNKKKIWMI